MKWSNLKINRCPQCSKDFTKNLECTTIHITKEEFAKLLTHSCGFKIYEQHYKEIVSSMIGKRLLDEKENENNTDQN